MALYFLYSHGRCDTCDLQRGLQTPILLSSGIGWCRRGQERVCGLKPARSGSDGVGTKWDTVMHDHIKKQLAELIECYRVRCLWFLAEDFVPETPEQAMRVLEYIEHYGDREGFVRARRLKQWLSPSINEASVS